MDTNYELIKTWHKNHVTFRLYDTHTRDVDGKSRLAYQFKDGRDVIFEGDDFHPSPLYAIDSLQSVYSLLAFLSLQLGDTDTEDFANYTEGQFAWSNSDRCYELYNLVMDYEERKDKLQ